MSPLPFLPAGQSSVPSQRSVVFANTANRVGAIDESLKTEDGTTFVGLWVSPSLNRAGQQFQWSLKEVHLEYIAEVDETELRVKFSGDGGNSYTVVRDITLSGDDTLRKISVFGNVTGPDLRFAIEMREDDLVKVLSWLAVLTRRGIVDHG